MRSCFSLKVQQNYWRLKKKKWEIENVIGLANVLHYRYLSEEIILFCNHLKDMNANTNINEVSFNVWTTEC